MIRIGCKKGGVTMNSNKEISSVSLNELKEFVQQFAPVIPEEKQLIIYDTIEQVETSGGLQTEAQAQTILINLLKGLGL